MKITIRPLFRKIKNFADEYTKAFVSMFGGFLSIISSSIFQFHSIAQLDIICVNPVWNYATMTNLGYAWLIPQMPWVVTRFSDQYFQDGIIYRGTIGGAYDFFLSMNVIGWALAIVGTFFVMFGVVLFYRANYFEWKELSMKTP